jgi:cell division septation protein DedD
VKERLTGAIILVVLIVLLVPELLSGPSRPAPAPQAAATSEEPPLRSYTINLADDSHSASAQAGSSSAPAQASGPAQPTPIVDSRTAEQSMAAQPADPDSNSPAESSPNASGLAPAQNSPSASSAPGESWQEQPKPAAPRGPTPQQQRSAVPDRAAPDRTAAQRYAAAEKPPAERSPATDRAEAADRSSSTGGWMVQLGVFSIQANAERLAQELKSQGFHALVSENGGGGRPLWRVRAGPVSERAAAEQLSAKLRAAGHAGSIVPK